MHTPLLNFLKDKPQPLEGMYVRVLNNQALQLGASQLGSMNNTNETK